MYNLLISSKKKKIMRDGFQGQRAIIMPQPIIAEMESNPFLKQLHITDIGYYPSAALHKRVRTEGISQNILIYCVDGSGSYKLNGKEYNVEGNECFVLPALTPHEYYSSPTNPWTIYWIHFKGEMGDFFCNALKDSVLLPPSQSSRIGDRLRVFEDIYNALMMGFSRENLEFAASALYYFLGSIKYLEAYRGATKNQERNLIEDAIWYMKENIEKSITLSSLSHYVGYSDSYFSAIFKSKTGKTPIAYMLHLRMQTACHLLDFSDMKINQICHKVGISDPYHFSKLFTKIVGLSPSAYRACKKG